MSRRARRSFAPLLLALVAATCTACGREPASDAALASEASSAAEQPAPTPRPEDLVSDEAHETVVLELTGLGEIHIELLPEIAPQTVANFKKLAGEGFYNGTTFHRVIPGFMVQGGDPASKNPDPRDDGKGGPGYTIRDEFSEYPHLRGTVSMANAGMPNSAGSQFFIVHEDSPNLDGAYAAFGRVVQGMDVVDAITQLEIDKFGRYGPTDRPYPVDARVVSVGMPRAPPQALAPAEPRG